MCHTSVQGACFELSQSRYLLSILYIYMDISAAFSNAKLLPATFRWSSWHLEATWTFLSSQVSSTPWNGLQTTISSMRGGELLHM